MKPGGAGRLLLLPACLAGATLGEAASPPRVERLELRSRVFANTRTIRVLLPAGYDEHGRERYPVLYLNDGYAVFHGWDVRAAAARLAAATPVRIIVVGIDNAASIPGGTASDRARELLPWPDATNEPPVPVVQGDRYPEFLVGEVLPAVERRYRTAPGPSGRGLGGASYGALAALYAAAHRPGVFGRLLIESAPLFVADFRILGEISRAPSWPGLTSIGVGARETGDPRFDARIEANAERLRAAIAAADPAARVRVYVEPGASHETAAWRRRLPAALRWLYAPPASP